MSFDRLHTAPHYLVLKPLGVDLIETGSSPVVVQPTEKATPDPDFQTLGPEAENGLPINQ